MDNDGWTVLGVHSEDRERIRTLARRENRGMAAFLATMVDEWCTRRRLDPVTLRPIRYKKGRRK